MPRYNFGLRHYIFQPRKRPVGAECFVEGNDRVVGQFIQLAGPTVSRDSIFAGINCPERFRDLSADQLIFGISGTESYVSFTFGQVEITITRNKFDF